MKPKLLLLAVLPLLMAAAARAADPAQSDRGKLHGTWKVVSFTVDGKEAPAAIVKKLHVVFEGDRMGLEPSVLMRGGQFEFGKANANLATFKLDTAHEPRTIDFKQVSGSPKFFDKGIYRLEGANLKVCFNAGGARPKDFSSKPGSGNTLLVLHREGR